MALNFHCGRALLFQRQKIIPVPERSGCPRLHSSCMAEKCLICGSIPPASRSNIQWAFLSLSILIEVSNIAMWVQVFVRVHMDKEEWFWNIFDFYFLFGVLLFYIVPVAHYYFLLPQRTQFLFFFMTLVSCLKGPMHFISNLVRYNTNCNWYI